MKHVIKEIILAGGACPYQLEALTTENKYLYLRYRGGWLRAGVSDNVQSFKYTVNDYNIIRQKIGRDFDGSIDHDTAMVYLKDLIEFPEGFKLQYDYS